MTTNLPQLPLSAEQLTRLQAATQGLTTTQLAWVSGYCWGKLDQDDSSSTSINATTTTVTETVTVPTVTLISASQTGNARRLAEQLRDDLLAAQFGVTLFNASEFKFKQIAQHEILIVVTSTQGEGEPPEEAVALFKYLHSRKAPKLSSISFAVFGLGDSSYAYFCQAGKDLDQRLAELGAQRLIERVDADLDYQDQAVKWRSSLVELLSQRLPRNSAACVTQAAAGAVDHLDSTPYTREAPLTASLAVNQKITGRNSQKDIRHLEIDLGEADLRYQPGDALGVWYQNSAELVAEILSYCELSGEESVVIADKNLSLTDALTRYLELTVNTAQIVAAYANLSGNTVLQALGSDRAALQAYAEQYSIVDMLRRAPTTLQASQLVALLRPLTPRLYSIASSQEEVANEVHLTLGVVRYESEGLPRSGGASGWLADQVPEEGEVKVFIEHNDNFRLPDDPQAPVIMIGPGTGIAPFRAFLQHRDNLGAKGDNWLFFGNPHFTEDFLYQVEWQQYVKQGLLTRIDLAWSRDQAEKIYVQDKLRQQGAEVWRWLQRGAHLYVCGDATRMAKDVEQALREIIAQYGEMDIDAADDYLSELRLERRYQRDVY